MTVEAPRQPNRAKGAAAVSAAALAIATALIASNEGEVRHVYVDHLGRGEPLSWCYGETAGNVKLGDTFTHEECIGFLRKSAEKHAKAILPCIPAGLPDRTAAAFYDFGYNIGSAGFCRSSVSRKAMAGDLRGACRSISLYVYSAGKDCRVKANKCGGITRRRADETALCLSGLS